MSKHSTTDESLTEFSGFHTPVDSSLDSQEFHDSISVQNDLTTTMATPEIKELIKNTANEAAEKVIEKYKTEQENAIHNKVQQFQRTVIDPMQIEINTAGSKITDLAGLMDEEFRRARFADFANFHRITNMAKNLMILNCPPSKDTDPKIKAENDEKYVLDRLKEIAEGVDKDEIGFTVSAVPIKKIFRLELSKSDKPIRGGYKPKYFGKDKIRVTFCDQHYRNVYLHLAEKKNNREFAIELTREECQFNDYL